jgi:hypothetical protein
MPMGGSEARSGVAGLKANDLAFRATNARNASEGLPAPAGPRPVLRHADPQVSLPSFLALRSPVWRSQTDFTMLQAAKRPEVEPDFDAPIFFRVDFLAVGSSHERDLHALDFRAAGEAVRGGGVFGGNGGESVLIFRIALPVRRVGAVVGRVGDFKDDLLVENVRRVRHVVDLEPAKGAKIQSSVQFTKSLVTNLKIGK